MASRREDLISFADAVIDSMIAKDASALPVCESYAATEDGKANVLPLFTAWQTITAAPAPRRYVADPEAGQVFFAGVVNEGRRQAIFLMRLKVDNGRLAEFESHFVRAPADSGAHFDIAGLLNAPAMWWTPPSPADAESRQALLEAATSAHDVLPQHKAAAEDCLIIDTGHTVSDGARWPIADMPVDPNMRTPILDVELGISLGISLCHGFVLPGGVLIPDSMSMEIRKHYPKLANTPLFTPRIRAQRAAGLNFQLTKFVGGKVRGVLGFPILLPAGSRTIWA